jgi:hypothetical protein
MLGGDDDAGRAGIHAEADRPAAAEFHPDLRHAIRCDRPVGEGDVECPQSAILRRWAVLGLRMIRRQARKGGGQNDTKDTHELAGPSAPDQL